jgi:hypothetical protein
MRNHRTTALVAVLALGLTGPALAACGKDKPSGGAAKAAVIDPGDGGKYSPTIDPAKFVKRIDNPRLPLLPGASWAYEEIEDGETQHVEVKVTDEQKTVMGVPVLVVSDVVSSADGKPIEVTADWFAQDTDGNVWYMGEDTKEYKENGKVNTKGSWEGGVDGAQPGIVMPAKPVAGKAYRQEYYRGKAEDMAQVVRLDATGKVPAGSYKDAVVIKEWNPLEPDVVEEKYYASGVGNFLTVITKGGKGREELVRFTAGKG